MLVGRKLMSPASIYALLAQNSPDFKADGGAGMSQKDDYDLFGGKEDASAKKDASIMGQSEGKGSP